MMFAGDCDVQRRVESAVDALTAGAPALIVSGSGVHEVADVVLPAALASPRWTAWTIRYSSGLLCAAMRATRADQLDLPAMVRGREFGVGTPAFGVGVDAAVGIGTGISATDRARTARVLAGARTRAEDLSRPGHVLPIRTAAGGVIECRAGAEAAVDLCEIAGHAPVALIATLVGDDGGLLRGAALSAFTRVHRVPIVGIGEVVHHRLHHRGRVRQTASRVVDVPDRSMRVIDFTDELTGAHHTVYVGSSTSAQAPTVHVVAECPHRDPLAADCGCRREFETRRARIAVEGGVIVYLRSPAQSGVHGAVGEDELAQGCITAMLTHLGFNRPLDYQSAASL